MSKEEKSNEWDSLWQEYTKSLENWKTMFEQVQNANNDMQAKFNEVWEKASKESSLETMKSFGENWQNALSNAGMNSFKEFSDAWQKALNDTNADAYKKFAETWQKNLLVPGMGQMEAYGELMKKFAETWSSMWPTTPK
jgi:Skp family chaperone for outer membrane proteins